MIGARYNRGNLIDHILFEGLTDVGKVFDFVSWCSHVVDVSLSFALFCFPTGSDCWTYLCSARPTILESQHSQASFSAQSYTAAS